MSKTIAQLWNGTLESIRYSGETNREIKELENLMQINFNEIEKTLNEEQKLLLNKYSNCVNEYINVISEQVFCDGFGLGTKLITEALSASEQII